MWQPLRVTGHSPELECEDGRGFHPISPRAGIADPVAPLSRLGIVDFAADSQAGADSDSNKPFMKAAGK